MKRGIEWFGAKESSLQRPRVLQGFLEVAGLQEQAGEAKGHLASDTHARRCSGPAGPRGTALTSGPPWPQAACAPGGSPSGALG